ncbi:PA3496 family putative envelope integrity protein [Stutzerimonas kirkiae]|uniref:Transcriptional regulator n=1 Tax=Stutzerimonas kirkiae TaxID=2211392 RepID=A0A4Q9RD23_9GAMM|nr:transcriptional regulator [Stutzerimonas kirkiae]TBU99261.1 transcriptional regulator [Stutzerimonas kirkiae]TBV06279.1 transcriptional regulator [Stutzerimonas kirkiae]TBV08023.1 transcriptional regulator [Stutzerimonas kirkiae]TBV15830.1 transcriptional regulator [Stutzerimonas kirkiae]
MSTSQSQSFAHDRRTRRQQEDLQRMRFRRAIEDYCERQRLSREISDFDDIFKSEFLPQATGQYRKSA